jgi:non-specific protein-tyrosine kinase
VPNTLIYNISVTGYDRAQIYAAADALAQTFVAIDQGKQFSRTSLALNAASTSFFNELINRTKVRLLGVLRSKFTPAEKYKLVVVLQNRLIALQNAAAQSVSSAGPTALSTANYVGTTPAVVLTPSVFVRNAVLFAALGGLIIGVALALLREYLDSSLRSAEELAEVLSLPVLATVHVFRSRSWRDRRPSSDAKASLITLRDPFHPGSEAFRNLRTGILFAGAARTVQTLVITSAAPSEGKSVIAANVAIVMAQAGSRVILVDADMRRPSQHTLFDLAGTTGLSSLYLAGEQDLVPSLLSALQQTPVPNLRVLGVGVLAPNPAELLASARTGAVIAALKEQADIVIFDTPPIALLTDAVILASHADGTVLVTRARVTRRDMATAAQAKLASVNARVLGAVLNMADLPHVAYGGRYYRHHALPTTPADTPETTTPTDTSGPTTPADMPAKGAVRARGAARTKRVSPRHALVQDQATKVHVVRARSDRSRRGLPSARRAIGSRRPAAHHTNPPETTPARATRSGLKRSGGEARPLHIVYVSFAGGGADTYVRQIARALCAAGQHVTVLYACAPGHTPGRPSHDGPVRIEYAQVSNVHYHHDRATGLLPRPVRQMLPSGALVKDLETAAALRRALRRIATHAGGIDLIEVFEETAFPVLFEHIAPYAVKLHSSDATWRYFCAEDVRRVDQRRNARRRIALESALLRHACLVSAPSAAVADHIARVCAYPRSRIVVLPYPLDTERFSPPPEETAGLRRSVLFVGRMDWRKGLETLARAAAAILSAAPTATLDIVGGETPDVTAARLLAYIPAQLHERVVFWGHVAHADLPAHYRRAAVCVVPSRWDNSPNTVYEAMGCGTPVVASRVGGIPELVTDGETGLLVPPDDPAALAEAVTTLLADPDRRARMGCTAREQALARVEAATIAAQTLELYRAALGHGAALQPAPGRISQVETRYARP